MKRILLSTAIAALAASSMATGALAADDGDMQNTNAASENTEQSKSRSAGDPSTQVGDRTIHASELIGKPVHIRAEGEDGSDNPENWERVGEIGDVIITKDGQIDSVTLDAGGFLGMNEKHVSTTMDELEFVAAEGEDGSGDGASDYVVVFTGDRSALEEREEVDQQEVRDTGGSFYREDDWTRQAATDMEGDAMQDDDANATASDDGDSMSENGDTGYTAELTTTERDALTAEDLEGTPVYGSGEEHLGEVSELVLSDDGKITQVVVDVGGFLGLGEKPVALPFDEIKLHNSDDASTDELRATTSYSEDELNAMESWSG